LWRTHYSNKSRNMTGDGPDIYLFLKSVKSYATMYNTRDVYIAWDKKLGNASNFRTESTDGDYKGTRSNEAAQEVYATQPKIDKATELLGCKNFYPWIMEADDIISWLSITLEGNNVIVTTDNDMLQLINKKTCVFHPKKKTTIHHDNFEESLGMPIEHYLSYKAILGDKSDNIKGIDGCGPVRSKKMAKVWMETPEKIPDKERVIIEQNIQLMDLSIGYKLAGETETKLYKKQLDIYKDIEPDFEGFESLCRKYAMNSILKDIEVWKATFEKPYLLKFLEEVSF